MFHMVRCSLLLSLTLLAGCATEGIHVRVMRPAPVNLGQYDLVAVDRFTGDGCDLLAADLTDGLRNSVNPLTGQTDFELVDRRDVDRMLEDLTGRGPGSSQERSMEVLERWRSAQLVLKGQVLVHEVHEERAAAPWVDPAGVQHVTVTRRATATVDTLIEAYSTDEDRLFDSVRVQEVVSAKASAVDAEPEPIDQLGLLATARKRVVARYLRRVQPHEEVVRIDLYTDGDLPQLQVGNGFAKTGDWQAAADSYREALEFATGELAEVRYKALFNLGVALQYTNRFAEARKSLKEAYALAQDGMILEQLQSVNYREQEYARLTEQGGQSARPN